MARFIHVGCNKYLTIILTAAYLNIQMVFKITVLQAKRETNAYKPFSQEQ